MTPQTIRRVIGSALLAAAAALPAYAQDKVVLTRKATVGDTARFTNEARMVLNAGGQKLAVEATVVEKKTVTAVGADGNITYTEQTESIQMSLNGTPLPPQARSVASTLTVRRNRSLAALDAGAETSDSVRTFHASGIVFPDTPVRVGDTWKRSVKADDPQGARAGSGEYKLLAFEKVGAIDTVKVSVKYKEAAANGISATGMVWVEIATGEDVKSELELTNLPAPQGGLATASSRTSRLPSGGVAYVPPGGSR